MFRKVVNILGMLSLAAVLAVAAVATYLVVTGSLNRQSVKAAVAAVTSRPAARAEDPPPGPTSQPAPVTADKLLAAGQEDEAAALGEMEMLRRQLADEKALLEQARLLVLREREKDERSRKQWEAARRKELEAAQRSGVQKDLEILGSLKPAQALDALRARPEPEAADSLMALETRKAKKIIELCKTAEERDWRKRILELIRAHNNVQAAALAGG